MAERDRLDKWTDEELLGWLLRVDTGPQSLEAVRFEIQRRLTERQLKAAVGLLKLASGLRWATWALVGATAVLGRRHRAPALVSLVNSHSILRGALLFRASLCCR